MDCLLWPSAHTSSNDSHPSQSTRNVPKEIALRYCTRKEKEDGPQDGLSVSRSGLITAISNFGSIQELDLQMMASDVSNYSQSNKRS